ncbi:lectin-like protein [Zhengella sp. ZM62]|uniref:lectin-like protein n=1 Tax=Zhengella sedimenti TaxID=3390035 RepID=UPI003975E43D
MDNGFDVAQALLPEPEDEPDDRSGARVDIEGMARVLKMTDAQVRIARMLHEVRTGDRTPEQFFRGLASDDMKATMFDVMKVRSKLVDHPESWFKDQILGPTYEAGGSPVERKLLLWRRTETKAAIKEVINRFRKAGRVPANDFKLIISHIGKWASQADVSLTFTGDIDFSFVCNDIDLAKDMKAAFGEIIFERTGLTPTALDSVATAHGAAGLEVYIGEHGMQFAEEQMKINEVVNLATGASRKVEGDNAVMEIAGILTSERAFARAAGIELPTPKVNNEPGLSMEMARHFQHDIVKPKLFDTTNAVVKAAKYLDRSYKALEAAGGTAGDPKLAKFAGEITTLANAKPQTGATRDSTVRAISDYFGSPPRTVWDAKSKKLVLTIDTKAIDVFHAKATKALWATVVQGSDTQTKMMDQRLRDLLERDAKGDQEEAVKEEIAKLRQDMVGLVDMVEAEILAMKGETVPVEVYVNNAKVKAMIELLAKRFGTRILSIEELKDKRFVEEWLKAQGDNPKKTGLELIKSYIMERTIDAAARGAMQGVEKANLLLDFVDDRLLGSLRGEGDFAAFEAEMKNIHLAEIDPKTQTDALGMLTALKGKVASKIRETNIRLNEQLQATSARRQGMKLIMVYGLIDEMVAYRDAWNAEGWKGFATEWVRRRVPLGSAIESYVMGNTLRAGWDAITTIVPPLGLPEAAYGMAAAAYDRLQSTYWNEQLELFTDSLYETAVFKPEFEGAGDERRIVRFRLISTTYEGKELNLREFAEKREEEVAALRDQVARHRIDPRDYQDSLHGFSAWLDADKVLKANLESTDPVLMMLEDMANHEATGPKLLERIAEQRFARWEEVKLGYIVNLIKHLEDRRQADQILLDGTEIDLFEELRRIAIELGIEQAVRDGLQNEAQSSIARNIYTWLWDTKRSTLLQAPVRSEMSKAVQIGKKYLEAYKKVLVLARRATAEPSEGEERKLPAGAARDIEGPYLTSTLFLSGNGEPDLARARMWFDAIDRSRERTRAALVEIKRGFLPNANLDETDADYVNRAFGHEVWIGPYQNARLRDPRWTARGAWHRDERDKVYDEYRRWLEQKGPVELTVTAVDAEDAKKRLHALTISLEPTDGLGDPVSAFALGNSVRAGVSMGRYSLTVSSPGYLDAKKSVLLGRGLTPKPQEHFELKPDPAIKTEEGKQDDGTKNIETPPDEKDKGKEETGEKNKKTDGEKVTDQGEQDDGGDGKEDTAVTGPEDGGVTDEEESKRDEPETPAETPVFTGACGDGSVSTPKAPTVTQPKTGYPPVAKALSPRQQCMAGKPRGSEIPCLDGEDQHWYEGKWTCCDMLDDRVTGVEVIESRKIEGELPPPPQDDTLSASIEAPTLDLEPGQTIRLSAKVTGGSDPCTMQWKGPVSGASKTVDLTAPDTPGDIPVEFHVSDADGRTAMARKIFKVGGLTLFLSATPGPPVRVAVGDWVDLSVTLEKAGKSVAPRDYTLRWEPSTEVEFANAEGPGVVTNRVQFKKTGRHLVWVVALARRDGALSTVAESNQVAIDVVEPSVALTVLPQAPYIGEEVRITAQERPVLDDKDASYWWEFSGDAYAAGATADQRVFSFKPRSTAPVVVTAHLKGRADGNELASESVTVTAQPYSVSVVNLGPAWGGDTTRTKVWKPGEGTATLEQGISTFEDVRLRADIMPVPKDTVLRYVWSVDEASTLSGNGATRETRVQRLSAGSIDARVEIRNADNVVLGTGTISVPVTAPTDDSMTDKTRADELTSLITQARQQWAAGEVDRACDRARKAAATDGTSREAASLVSSYCEGARTISGAVAAADRALSGLDIASARTWLAAGETVNRKAKALEDLAKRIAEAESRRDAVPELIGEASQALANGDIDGARKAVEEALAINPNDPEANALKQQVETEAAALAARKAACEQRLAVIAQGARQISARDWASAVEMLDRGLADFRTVCPDDQYDAVYDKAMALKQRAAGEVARKAACDRRLGLIATGAQQCQKQNWSECQSALETALQGIEADCPPDAGAVINRAKSMLATAQDRQKRCNERLDLIESGMNDCRRGELASCRASIEKAADGAEADCDQQGMIAIGRARDHLAQLGPVPDENSKPDDVLDVIGRETIGNYEIVYTGGGLTWAEAESAARAAGGHLLVINSAQENEHFLDLVREKSELWFIDEAGNTQGPWLGGYQPEGSSEPGGGWRWVTGEAFDYTNWTPGEPNNVGGAENCAQFFGRGRDNRNVTWNDVGCESRSVRAYIIEFPASDAPDAKAACDRRMALIATGAQQCQKQNWSECQSMLETALQGIEADCPPDAGSVIDRARSMLATAQDRQKTESDHAPEPPATPDLPTVPDQPKVPDQPVTPVTRDSWVLVESKAFKQPTTRETNINIEMPLVANRAMLATRDIWGGNNNDYVGECRWTSPDPRLVPGQVYSFTADVVAHGVARDRYKHLDYENAQLAHGFSVFNKEGKWTGGYSIGNCVASIGAQTYDAKNTCQTNDWSPPEGQPGDRLVFDVTCSARAGSSGYHFTYEWQAAGAQTGEAASDAAAGCAGLPGEWNWFINGIVTIRPDHTHQQGDIGGTWSCTGTTVRMEWNHGYVDELELSADGMHLSGKGWPKSNPNGTYPVSGDRRNVETGTKPGGG